VTTNSATRRPGVSKPNLGFRATTHRGGFVAVKRWSIDLSGSRDESDELFEAAPSGVDKPILVPAEGERGFVISIVRMSPNEVSIVVDPTAVDA